MKKIVLLSLFMFILASVSNAQNSEEEGVVINGVRWASRNVGTVGAFVDNPEDAGNYYSWDDAVNVCPKGWRLPTEMECQSLILSSLTPSGMNWTTQNGIRGLQCGNDNNTIFLPVTGNIEIDSSPFELNGYYWVGDNDEMYYANYIFFSYDNGWNPTGHSLKSTRLGVRCVAETSSAINAINNDNITFQSNSDGIIIETKIQIPLLIYNIFGQKVYKSIVNGKVEIRLKKGVYILNVNNKSEKVIVKDGIR